MGALSGPVQGRRAIITRMSLTESPQRRHALRVLVLSADVGEGHVAAARALSEGLRALGTVDVVSRDGLSAFGAVTRHMIRDGYRWQLRWAPWTYSAMYWLVTRVAPVRGAGALALAVAGQRRLRRIVRREQPDVVVTTHPALTCVLGRMRLRRRLAIPLCAAITDLADYRLWSHRGADLHLVMHEHGVAPVELVAGAGSAALVRPIVAARFLEVADRETARRRLGLRVGGRLVAVSGGGWGVGDLAGAVDAALGCDDTDGRRARGPQRDTAREPRGALRRDAAGPCLGLHRAHGRPAARRGRGRAFHGRRDVAGGAQLRLPADRLRQLDRPHPGAQPDDGRPWAHHARRHPRAARGRAAQPPRRRARHAARRCRRPARTPRGH